MKKFQVSGVHDNPVVFVVDQTGTYNLYSNKHSTKLNQDVPSDQLRSDPQKWVKENVPIHPDHLVQMIKVLKISQPEAKKRKDEDIIPYEVSPSNVTDILFKEIKKSRLSATDMINLITLEPEIASKYMPMILAGYAVKWSDMTSSSGISDQVTILGNIVDTRYVQRIQIDTPVNLEHFDISQLEKLKTLEFTDHTHFMILDSILKKRGHKTVVDMIYMAPNFEGGDMNEYFITSFGIKVFSDTLKATRIHQQTLHLFISGKKSVSLTFFEPQPTYSMLGEIHKSIVNRTRHFDIPTKLITLSLPEEGLNASTYMSRLETLKKLNLSKTSIATYADLQGDLETLRAAYIPRKSQLAKSANSIKNLTFYSDETSKAEKYLSAVLNEIDEYVYTDQDFSLYKNLETLHFAEDFNLDSVVIKNDTVKEITFDDDFSGSLRLECQNLVKLVCGKRFWGAHVSNYESDEPDMRYIWFYQTLKHHIPNLATIILKNPKLLQYADFILQSLDHPGLVHLEIGGKRIK